ncbi:DUF4276 family protein [Williamwhitmania taraxaci]|uniref:DUF4276 family protein n=1 Tax=Williamwhitmania taraxaci TaxID=1640674 RepID=A0A1G6GUT0_9BACT|nr:DUF4276 family protein [Williamwhitmania taraxaci]SDB85633.1 protein of unknown function [Williamwhitmania taraxaci]
MKRIIIISEGQTEQSFCNDVLQPYFNDRGIFIQNPAIKKMGGGIVRWDALKFQVETHLLQDNTAFVTTLVDYYGMYANMDYPGWENAQKLVDKNQRMTFLEKAMQSDIRPDLQRRFMPYIQLHEFEGLLFSNIDVFDRSFERGEFLNYRYLEETIDKHPNPEMINDSRDTAPSKRLMKIIKGYDKVVYGSLLAGEIGLNRIRAKCPRFNEWVARLECI